MSACTDREARTDATVMCWLELATESAEELAPLCRLPLSQYHRASASSIAGYAGRYRRRQIWPVCPGRGLAALNTREAPGNVCGADPSRYQDSAKSIPYGIASHGFRPQNTIFPESNAFHRLAR